ncbi:MAG: hypothetical protein WBN42_04700, partial [Ignavibacteriaceae bacterium]
FYFFFFRMSSDPDFSREKLSFYFSRRLLRHPDKSGFLAMTYMSLADFINPLSNIFSKVG